MAYRGGMLLRAMCGLAAWAACVLSAGALTTFIGGSGDEATLSWSGGATNDGYAVATCTSLVEDVWQYAADVDQWPVSGTNWTTSTDADRAFYRVRHTARGRLTDSSVMYSVPLVEIIGLVDYFDSLYPGVSNAISPIYAVEVYRLVYETFDHRGVSTIASGALAVPTGPAFAPLLSYQHGTVFKKTESPSNPGVLEMIMGVVVASEGYIVSMADYIGLGTNSPGLHPYIHARSEAVACVDMLRATRSFIAANPGPVPDGHLFLMGYSQGGHATAALQRELESRYTNEFPVTASAPMAGPYDLSGTMADGMVAPVAYSDPAYVPYILFGYNTVYQLFESPSEVLVAPYDTTLPPYFNGEYSGSEINAVMPSIPRDIFRPEFVSEFESDTNHFFRVLLRSNDMYRWVPQAPTRLYHCAGDTTVSPVNTQVAYSNFVANGATDVSVHDPAPAASHSDGAVPCLIDAKLWFDTFWKL